VLDATRAAIAGAKLRVEPIDGGTAVLVISDAEGRFAIAGLAPGTYLVTVTSPGFAPATTTVVFGSVAPAPIELLMDPAGVAQEVTVSATRLPTPVSSIPNTVTILDRDVIEGRTGGSDDLASLLESSVPGYGPSLKKLTGRGESLRGRNPLYTINGVPQHAPLRDGERDGHTIDLDFVDRIEVIHGANAIQGIGATGGVVNLVTKSPRGDGAWTHDVRLATGVDDGFDDRGWSSKASYLLGKRTGRVDVVGGVALQKRGLFFDGHGDPIGLYPTQGDIMDSTSRAFYAKAGVQFTTTRRLEVMVNDFRLERDGDYVAVPGSRGRGRLATTIEGDPKPVVGDPAVNDAITASVDYRDRSLWGGEVAVQGYVQDADILFEGGAFPTFALTVGGPAFLDQSAITTSKLGAKLTYARTTPIAGGLLPSFGLDVARDETAQVLARTGRVWVPETRLQDAAPFVQLQRLFAGRLLVSGGLRVELATVSVDDFRTLPSSGAQAVGGGSPSFTDVLPNLGIVHHLRDDLSAYASFSEGFTMPDVGRVLRAVNVPGQDVDTLVDIDPIVADNIEVGLDFTRGPARFHAAYYRSASERGSLLQRTIDNVYRVRRQPTRIEGVDLVAEAALDDRWSIGGNFAWLRGRYDASGDGATDTDLDGLNLAPNRLNVYVQGDTGGRLGGRLTIATLFPREFRGVGIARPQDFGGYTTADLSLALRTAAGTLRFGVENLLDRQYVTYFSQTDPLASDDTLFAGPGRGFTIALERRF
jgi:iron complex outermembrane receptor protein